MQSLPVQHFEKYKNLNFWGDSMLYFSNAPLEMTLEYVNTNKWTDYNKAVTSSISFISHQFINAKSEIISRTNKQLKRAHVQFHKQKSAL